MSEASEFVFDPQRYPTSPGVYLMRGAKGEVLYVGKARSLRARLRTYFSSRGDGRAHIRFLMPRVTALEIVVTDTEKEALILENTLIKKHRPRYNLTLRDDKTYISLRLDPREEFPGLQIVRKVMRDGASYFGPFASAQAVRQTLKEVYRIFPLRHYPWKSCQRRLRPCLFFQIGQCSAPCHGKISRADYGELVQGVMALLSGREADVVALLRQEMTQAAEAFRYEEAARVRDQIRAIEQTVERQKVVDPGGGDSDIVGLHREGGELEVAILFVRQGKLVGQRTYPLEWRLDDAALLVNFLQQFYARDVLIPKEILIPFQCEDLDVLEEWLTERAGRKVRLLVPQRGERLRLVQLAERNAAEAFRQRGSRRESKLAILEEIQQVLKLSRLPRRMECFDISHVQGRAAVGSMAVVVEGEAVPAAYRSYHLRTVEGNDDYASLYEVLTRRLQRGLREDDLPDFILIDGGRGQLAVLCRVLDELHLADRVEAAGMAKSRVQRRVRSERVERSEERFFLPQRSNPVVMRQGSPALFLLERLRDEAHRFAVTRHRKRREKESLLSSLDAIPGIGPSRRRLLLRHFGSLKAIREADLETLCALPGLPEHVARRLYQELKATPSLS